MLGEADTDLLQATLKQLLDQYRIYRAKGFIAIPNKPMRQVLQAVGRRIDTHFDRPWSNEDERKTQLVFIGKELDEQYITAELQKSVISVAV